MVANATAAPKPITARATHTITPSPPALSLPLKVVLAVELPNSLLPPPPPSRSPTSAPFLLGYLANALNKTTPRTSAPTPRITGMSQAGFCEACAAAARLAALALALAASAWYFCPTRPMPPLSTSEIKSEKFMFRFGKKAAR